MGVLDAIIEVLGLAVGVGTTIYSASEQSKLLQQGESAEKEIYLGQMAESRAARKAQERLQQKQLSENKRQFNLSYGLQQEQLGLQKEGLARESFQNRMNYLTGILDKNKGLQSLMTNSLAGLRR
ncbi:MAG: hypothetical protein ACWGNI_00080 [Desulfobacterales bacterium]